MLKLIRMLVCVLPGCMLALAVGAPGRGQDFAPPQAQKVDAKTRKDIQAKMIKLGDVLAELRRKGLDDPFLAEVEVFHQAAYWVVHHDEFFQPQSAQWTLDVLDRGLERAKQAEQKDFSWFETRGRSVVRAYRSRIDDSVQPYAVTFPAAYGKDPKRKWRVDVVLHGRDNTLTEVKFLNQHKGDKPVPADQDFVKIDIYGRGNNAYRWAGEVDVWEAVENFRIVESALRRRVLDQDRWVLRGFSMGGAGVWHLGLHRPDTWCVLGPGAGFTSTHGYIKKLPVKLPDHQERCLRIYDAVDYAENVFNVPVVAYSGEKDPQMQAARNIELRLKGTELASRMTHVIAPDLEHKFPPEWQKKVQEAFAPYIKRGREEYPQRVRFVTYTLKYPACDWVRILGLDRHYDRSLVDARKTEDGFVVTTENVRSLRLVVPKGTLHDLTVKIDKQELTARPWGDKDGPHSIYLVRREGRWVSVLPQRLLTELSQRVQKTTGLQGPIDSAFTDTFLCVRGTGTPWHPGTQRYADAELRRFRAEWAKFWRGDLPVKDDTDVNNNDIAEKHLILFGDPSSNSLIAQVLDGLPLTWTKEKIAFAGKTFAPAEHVPVLVYPSPLNANRYVVLNSGHTFHEADYKGTNALLYPRLGDYAVLQLRQTPQDALAMEPVLAGLFDEYWQIPK
jgi:hypothetical protein